MGNYDRYKTPNGKILNGRTFDMWWEAEYIVGKIIPITQGSYNKGGVAASAGVHDGGGTVDCPARLKGVTTDQLVRALRRVGFAAFYRKTIAGLWPEHIHCAALGDKELSWQAFNQTIAYIAGYDGLGHLGRGGKDTGPRNVIQTWEEYKKKHPNRFPVK